MLLQVAPRGKTLLRELAPLRRRINDVTFHSLTPDRAATLHDILGTLIADAKAALHELEAPHMDGARAPSAGSAAREDEPQAKPPRRAPKS
jgi:hypothetical protein